MVFYITIELVSPWSYTWSKLFIFYWIFIIIYILIFFIIIISIVNFAIYLCIANLFRLVELWLYKSSIVYYINIIRIVLSRMVGEWHWSLFLLRLLFRENFLFWSINWSIFLILYLLIMGRGLYTKFLII